MTTAITIINLALKDAGVIGESQTASSETAADALQCLNDMLALWNSTGLSVFAQQTINFPCTGLESYTIGTGGVVNNTRPNKINFAYWRSGNYDYELLVEPTFEEYSRITQKTLSGQPNVICYVPSYPLAVIHVYPQPTTGSIYLGVDVPLPISSVLTSALDITPQYVMAVRFNLAVILSATFSTQLRADVAKIAANSLRMVQRNNVVINELRNTVPSGGNRSSGIFTG